MAQKDAIADAVAERLTRDRIARRAWITTPVKIAGAGLGLVISFATVANLVVQVWT